MSPDHPKNRSNEYKQVENRTLGMKYAKHEFSKNYTPDFLKHTITSPTRMISPAKYDLDGSFRTSQEPKRDFRVNKGRRTSFTEMSAKLK